MRTIQDIWLSGDGCEELVRAIGALGSSGSHLFYTCQWIDGLQDCSIQSSNNSKEPRKRKLSVISTKVQAGNKFTLVSYEYNEYKNNLKPSISKETAFNTEKSQPSLLIGSKHDLNSSANRHRQARCFTPSRDPSALIVCFTVPNSTEEEETSLDRALLWHNIFSFYYPNTKIILVAMVLRTAAAKEGKYQELLEGDFKIGDIDIKTNTFANRNELSEDFYVPTNRTIKYAMVLEDCFNNQKKISLPSEQEAKTLIAAKSLLEPTGAKSSNTTLTSLYDCGLLCRCRVWEKYDVINIFLKAGVAAQANQPGNAIHFNYNRTSIDPLTHSPRILHLGHKLLAIKNKLVKQLRRRPLAHLS